MPLIKCIELAARHSAENGAFTSFLACKTFSEIVEQTWSNGGVSYATDKVINTFHRLEQCDKILCRKFAIVFISKEMPTSNAGNDIVTVFITTLRRMTSV